MQSLSKAAVTEATRSRAAFELKGVVGPLTVMRLRTHDLNLVERQLRAKLLQMPGFFEDAAVLLDLSSLEGSLRELPLAALVHVLRSMRVVPVGATGVSESDRDFVRAAGLALLKMGPARARDDAATPAPTTPEPVVRAATPARTQPATSRPAPPPLAETRAHPHRPPLVLRQAVRSGQEIYARNTDLIVLAPVNPGAQIYADGHIHVYSTLRGRAMAGAQGLTEARIFVQKLEAELVAIAGAYVMADDIPRDVRGKSVQVFLENGECRIASVGVEEPAPRARRRLFLR